MPTADGGGDPRGAHDRTSAAGTAEPLPLEGLRVVDLTRGFPGPLAGRLLAEAGADVVKVEDPEGDPARAGAGFATWNRSKRACVVDLDDRDGRESLDRLLSGADVVILDRPVEWARRHGLDDATLRRRFPTLVVASLTGYPIGHRDQDRPGWEILVQARYGAMDEQEGNRDGPIFLRLPVASWCALYLLVIGILARLLDRDRCGQGGPVRTSLAQGLLTMYAMFFNRAERPSANLTAKAGLQKTGSSPSAMVFECQDGAWLQALPGMTEAPIVLETLAEMGLSPEDAPFMANPGFVSADFDPALWRSVFLRRPANEWLEGIWLAGAPAEEILPFGRVLLHPEAEANGYTVEVDDPAWGPTVQAAAPYTMTPPARVRAAAPQLGSDQARWAVAPGAGAAGRARRPEPGAARRGDGPLAGLKVLDLGMFWAGPFGPALLSDLGAEVIKLEPTTGDRMRYGVHFPGCQRGKRSLAVDLRRPEGRPVLHAAVRWADVVHHNLRMSAASRLGLDPDSIRAINPEVVFCHASAYGLAGARTEWPGYDPIAQALSGWPRLAAGEGGRPMWHRFAVTDTFCAMASLIPTLLALRQRSAGGGGRDVATSLLAGAVFSTSETLAADGGGSFPPPVAVDRAQTGVSSFYRIYRSSDGWVAVAAVGARSEEALLRSLEVASAGQLEAAIAAIPSASVLAALDAADVPAEAVRLDYEQAFFDDPEHRRCALTVAYPHAAWGLLEQPGAYWDFVDRDLRLDTPPPELGEHTEEVLAELGFSPGHIAELAALGVIAVYPGGTGQGGPPRQQEGSQP